MSKMKRESKNLNEFEFWKDRKEYEKVERKGKKWIR